MRCDDCHQEISPVVLIDIDGTIANYHDSLSQFCLRYWNVWVPRPIEELVCTWNGEGNFEDYLGLTRAQYQEAKLAFRQGGHKRWMPVYYEAFDFIDKLERMGVNIWFTTTRPWQRLDNVDPDTREWLQRHGFRYEGLLYDEFKYSKILDIVDRDRILGVIDDLPEMYDHAIEEGLAAFQVARTHNSGPSQRRQVRGTLGHAVQWVHNRLTEWEKQHEG